MTESEYKKQKLNGVTHKKMLENLAMLYLAVLQGDIGRFVEGTPSTILNQARIMMEDLIHYKVEARKAYANLQKAYQTMSVQNENLYAQLRLSIEKHNKLVNEKFDVAGVTKARKARDENKAKS